MKHSDVMLETLTDYMGCADAVRAIEDNWKNYEGGLKRWQSGKETVLLASAKKKISAIWLKAEKFETFE